jgi:purine-binding chemotaxis protein CheW
MQFLTFLLGKEEYGIEILKVQEIKQFTAITPLPNLPPHIRGVMNLRGTMVPVVDLRARFGMPVAEYGKFTVIVIVTVGTRSIGLVVDAVSDVVDITREGIEPPPELGSTIDTSFMSGMAKAGERLLLLLDIQRLLGADGLASAA